MPSKRRLEVRILRFLRLLGLNEDRVFLILTIVVGAVCGLAAVFFHLLIEWISDLTLERVMAAGSSYYILVPAAGGVVVGILLKLVPDARGSGIPQVKTSFFLKYGVIPLQVTLGKIFLGATCIGTGFSLGREGPTVQICSGIASFAGRLLSLSRQRVRTLIPIGAAAGLAAAFNTPISGVVFALEEIVDDINANILGSTVIAAVTASIVEHSLLGDNPIFGLGLPAYRLGSPVELIFYLLLGLCGGFVSVAFVKALLKSKSFLESYGSSRTFHPAIGGLMVGLLALLTPQIMGMGYPTVNSTLAGNMTFQGAILLLALKFAATIISYASGASGGIFAPTLFIGAMLGETIGAFLNLYDPALTPEPGAFALVGMGVLFAGIIRAPMTSVLIIFEMTRNYHIMLPLMVANLASYYVSQRFQPVPVYEALNLQDGIHLPKARQEPLLGTLSVKQIMRTSPICLPADLSVAEAIRKAETFTYSGFPVLDPRGRFLGMISYRELKQLSAREKDSLKLSEVIRPGGPHSHSDQSLEIVLRKFGQYGVSRLPVLSRTDPGELQGIVTLGDLMRVYGGLRQKELAAEEEWDSELGTGGQQPPTGAVA